MILRRSWSLRQVGALINCKGGATIEMHAGVLIAELISFGIVISALIYSSGPIAGAVIAIILHCAMMAVMLLIFVWCTRSFTENSSFRIVMRHHCVGDITVDLATQRVVCIGDSVAAKFEPHISTVSYFGELQQQDGCATLQQNHRC